MQIIIHYDVTGTRTAVRQVLPTGDEIVLPVESDIAALEASLLTTAETAINAKILDLQAKQAAITAKKNPKVAVKG